MPTIPYAVKHSTDPDPAPVFKFWVEIGSKIVAEFKECSGLGAERKIETYKEGGRNDYLHKLPGQVERSNITLKYGVLVDKNLWDWFHKGLYNGQVERVNLSILLPNTAGEVVRRWDFVDAFPVKWEGPQLNAESNQLAIETVEITHRNANIADGGSGSGGPETIMRTLSGSTALGGSGSAVGDEEQSGQKIDLEGLAYRVYKLLKQEARIERERSGR